MLSLDPEKLFIVLIVALVLLGPDKLPKFARQLGAGWSKLRAFQQRIESEVRETMPELPPTHEIARMVRSPVSYLNSLTNHEEDLVPDPASPAAAQAPDGTWPSDPAAPPISSGNGHSTRAPNLVRSADAPAYQIPADPSMN